MKVNTFPSSTGFNTVNGKYCCNFTIHKEWLDKLKRFNTVNGKYCCNDWDAKNVITNVSEDCFNTVNGKYCCNWRYAWC